jgi:hypothetical protein
MSESDEHEPNEPLPLHGQVRHMNLSARVPEDVGRGVFSNGVMILTGAFELVLDFVLRLGEPNRIVARVVLPHVVAGQFVGVLQENLRAFEERFGPIPKIPRPRTLPEDAGAPIEPSMYASSGGPVHSELGPQPVSPPQIEDIYDELRLPDSMLSGAYANAVLVRHSGTEFCFDFITNIFPRSAVSCRVFLSAPHVPLLLQSLSRAMQPPISPP